MTRLLDSNIFITANNSYYALDLVPGFWVWLETQAGLGHIASTDLVYDELRSFGDDLSAWVMPRRNLLFHLDSTSAAVAAHVASLGQWADATGYQAHVKAEFMACADPFIVGVAAEHELIVVTHETPGGTSLKKIKIPNACDHLGVAYENPFAMLKAMGAHF